MSAKLPENDRYAKKIQSFDKKVKGTVVLMILATFSLTFLFGTFDIVESGTVKLAVEPSGEIKLAGPGWHMFWCSPLSTKYDFVVNVQTITISNMHADTQDGHVNIDLSVNYQLAKENVTEVFETFGANYNVVIQPVIESAFRDEFSGYSMREVALDNRSTVQQHCRDMIEIELQDYFINLMALKVQNILLPTAFSDAQIQTQIAEEELRAANITAQIQILEATTAAQVSIIEAEALANSTIIEANGTAEAIQQIVQELNVTGNITEDDVLNYLYIQVLTDMAEYGNVILITDGTTPFIFQIPDEGGT
ncbi:MAG: hypothetical protein GF364_21485 [Candidatus Lokiarchaeota archaeon]|nr:hypothetical protein [Candidatus Lokiarchaeota archaeon]